MSGEAEGQRKPTAAPALKSSVEPVIYIGKLPSTDPKIFGRKEELSWLDACWAEGVRVVSIVAFGGVGKSALVNTWLQDMDRDGWRGAARVYGWSFYSQGTGRPSSDEFVDWALRLLGDADPRAGSLWDKGVRLATLVRQERTLLILDGLEPLQWEPGVEEGGKLKDPALRALVKELGAQNKGLCVITSRLRVADLQSLAGDKVRAKALTHLSPEAGVEVLKAYGARGPDEELRAAADDYRGHSFSLRLLGSYLRNAHKGDIRKRDVNPPLAVKPVQRMMATYEQWFQNKPEITVLRMLGLFKRPAPEDEIAVLRASPVIVGLTDELQGLTQSAWNEAVTTLRDVGLLADGSNVEEPDRLDAHPVLHEHFGEQLKREQPEAWREGHRRLYEHLKKKAKQLPDTIEGMAPLYAAVVHGCLAGKSDEAFNDVFWKRISRGSEFFSTKKLGAFGSDIVVLSAFFEPPWARLAPGLSESDQAFVLRVAGSTLRALGRLLEATILLQLALERHIDQKDWESAAEAAYNLSGVLQARGELSEALSHARKSVELAETKLTEAEGLPQLALERHVAQASAHTPDLAAPRSRSATLSLQALLASSVRGSTKASENAEDWGNAAQDAFNEDEAPVDVLAAVKGYKHADDAYPRRERSEPLAQEGKHVELADQNGRTLVRRVMMTMVAAALHAEGRWEEASEHFEKAGRTQEDEEPASLLLHGLPGFQYCAFLLDRGFDAEVRKRTESTLKKGGGRDSLLDIALDHLSLGLGYLLAAQRGEDGYPDKATDHLQQAVDGLRSADEQEYLPLGLLARANLYIHVRNFDHAYRDLDEALTLATRCAFRLHEADAHLGYARLHLAQADPLRARFHLARARTLINATGYHRRDGDLARLEAGMEVSLHPGDGL